ncbi:MAG: DUF3768 domain-containing protein, partial [Myxococcales bacterium]|nr:DUF3768 domain-containing protein [Myxococcales bacterium]
LSDKARKGLLPGSTKVLLTREVTALPEDVLKRLVGAVKTFDAFTEDNDPYGERDFGAVELEGEQSRTSSDVPHHEVSPQLKNCGFRSRYSSYVPSSVSSAMRSMISPMSSTSLGGVQELLSP